MYRRTMARLVVLGWAAWAFPAGAAAGTETEALLRMMPGDFPLAGVVANMETLDKAIDVWRKRIEPEDATPGPLAGMRSDLPLGEWIDFSKPLGMASSSAGKEKDLVVWCRVPQFPEKVKELDGAVESEGVWHITLGEGEELFCKARGEYVVAATSREALAKATRTDAPSLADVLGSRLEALRQRDVLLHLQVEAMRAPVLGGIGQMAMMAPALAMMAGQQGGGDPALITAIVTVAADALKSFVTQLETIDISIGLKETAADLTLLAGFADGPIKNYLNRQKPGSAPEFGRLEEQPFFMAASAHLPGESSPFVDYVFEKLAGAVIEAPPAPAALPSGDAEGAPVTPPAQKMGLKEALRLARQVYARIEGENVVMSFSSKGMRVNGDYLAQDSQAMLDLFKQSVTSANPLMQQFGGGAEYEALGAKKVGDVTVEQFAMKIDPTDPAGAMAASLYGKDARIGFAAAEGRVRFASGDDQDIERHFGSPAGSPFAAGRYVKEALATLPARRNVVVLCDPAGVIPLLSIIGPMAGAPRPAAVPPGPPVAASVSLSGEPARIDVHVPLRAIERVKQAFADDESM